MQTLHISIKAELQSGLKSSTDCIIWTVSCRADDGFLDPLQGCCSAHGPAAAMHGGLLQLHREIETLRTAGSPYSGRVHSLNTFPPGLHVWLYSLFLSKCTRRPMPLHHVPCLSE